ncbi:DNA polymerase III subunit gamma/tau [Cryobacterium sp. LW097]|uniref:DNA polymerase III subunit gamma and tau n=1 Tax=Cryobacterium sp. LW097 TaxID=1978566 RepID=UPI000B4D9973|nr:DNA polymerase III subunit gamma and tau [Cryobacterium sp. LW097]ASD21063.1 DNA polymerase III subunit gamma/tau [Cryobacterium sp. LW097]
MVTALYRRYRPETFAEMIGQSQVTDPLMTALRTNRVNHAYLFSGPRGCGKTTSARILARCLNCAEGPTDTPCGVCPSCVELSRDGSGSLDVVEIDAASHNGVDDARDIRERAIFAPARDRYKIFILDEAHMVTPQGFNALLKIVEEPPEHVKFIFATTEPEKVIGTIRSRTHHYPFRLVPPAPMLDYVQQLCDSENMTVAPGVLPLVVRAGGGSPRDTLSLLDQLMAGSETDAIEYERAVALLGYTHATLLDDAIDSIAARNSSAAFDAVDRVIQTGQDPRRFVEDLLERMRDLIIVAATSAAAAAAVLRGVPQDELDRMHVQASKFGPAELSRTADILNAALTEMTGATSPRLHLELMIARVLIPAADDSTRGALARVERLERRIGVDGGSTDAPAEPAPAATAPRTPAAAPAPRTPAAASAPRPPAAQVSPPVATPPAATTVPPAAPGWATRTPGTPAAMPVEPAAAVATSPAADVSPDRAQADRPDPTAETPPPAAPVVPVGPVTLAQIKDAWPQILEAVKEVKLSAWLVVYTARVLDLRGEDILVLSFPSEQDMQGFKAQQAPGQGVSEFLRGAIVKVLGLRVKFIARADSETFAPTSAPASSAEVPTSGPAAPVRQGNSSAAGQGPEGNSPAGATPTASTTGSAPAASATSTTPTSAAVDLPSSGPAVFGGPSGDATSSSTSGTGPASATSTGTATATLAPPATSTGWATVVIPGSAAALAAAETAAGEPIVVPPVLGAPGSASTSAPTSAPTGTPSAPTGTPSAPAGTPDARSAPADTAPSSAPAAAPTSATSQSAPQSAPSYDYAPEPDFEPPFDEEPPPYDDLPPDPQQFAAPPEPPRGTRPATQQAPGQQAPRQQAPGRRSPAFAEKQRYGEAVVREILGATFIEEQPHDPISRQRNDN